MVIYFKNGNVTDEDLDDFVPAFSNRAQFAKIKGLKLNGSHVSLDALERFRQLVPDCEVLP